VTDLTSQQAKVLWVIMEQIDKVGRPPTLAEIARACNFKTHAGARCHVVLIEKKQYIRRTPSRACAIKPMDSAKEWYRDMKRDAQADFDAPREED
jgi:repressor LexA